MRVHDIFVLSGLLTPSYFPPVVVYTCSQVTFCKSKGLSPVLAFVMPKRWLTLCEESQGLTITTPECSRVQWHLWFSEAWCKNFRPPMSASRSLILPLSDSPFNITQSAAGSAFTVDNWWVSDPRWSLVVGSFFWPRGSGTYQSWSISGVKNRLKEGAEGEGPCAKLFSGYFWCRERPQASLDITI